MTWDRRHLLQLEGMSAADVLSMLDVAERWRDVALGRAPRLNLLAGRTIANLFFEESTRTRSSFTLAARRLGADTLEIASAGSSVAKGETMVDTALNLQAMGVSAMVVRCSAAGGAHMIARAVSVPVFNAGDGRHEHPTQGLLDLMTLRQRLGGDLKQRTIAIVGDILNSRVARSAIHGLTTLGARVLLCGPPTLVPTSFESMLECAGHGEDRAASAGRGSAIGVHHDLDAMLDEQEIDAIMMLRVQFERATASTHAAASPPKPAALGAHGSAATLATATPSLITADYHQLYGLTAARLARLPKHAFVMHPGPVNRGLELDSEVMDDPQRSAILQQVRNGVAVRMAAMGIVMGVADGAK